MVDRLSGTPRRPRITRIAAAIALALALGVAGWANRDRIAVLLAPTKKAASTRSHAALQADELFWRTFQLIEFDPKAVLSSVRCPTLALFGGKDVQVPPDVNRPAFDAAFAGGGHTKPTVITYPEANHLFMAARRGQPSEYGSLTKAFVPGLPDDVARWVSAIP